MPTMPGGQGIASIKERPLSCVSGDHGEFKILFGSISSLSPHAKNYFSKDLDKDINAIALNEVHKDDPLTVKSFF